jgi:thioredoxin reductase (NADPH)
MSVEKVVIVGSGPAGLTAGIYTSRAGLSPLIIDGSKPGGQLMTTSAVENWPGETSIPGPALMEQMRSHTAAYGARFLDATITKVDLQERPFVLSTNSGTTVQTQSIIIATGANPKKLAVPGEEAFWGRGVSTCAVCDGTFYKGKKVVVVGGGDTATESASFLLNFTNDITIVHILPKLTASHAMQQRVIDNPSIKIIYESTVTAIEGKEQSIGIKKVTQVTIKNQQTGEESVLPADGVFIAIGIIPNTALFKGQLELTPYGYIQLKEYTQTSVEGVFAAGDVADSMYRQAITSAGHGCAAAMDVERYLSERSLETSSLILFPLLRGSLSTIIFSPKNSKISLLSRVLQLAHLLQVYPDMSDSAWFLVS